MFVSMFVTEYFIHFLLSFSSAEYKQSPHCFSVLVPMHAFDLGESFCPSGDAQSKPNLPNDGCILERLIARTLLEAGEVL